MIAVIEQPDVIRQILDHLGITDPGAWRPPMRTTPESFRARSVYEHAAWTYDPREADSPLLNPLTE